MKRSVHGVIVHGLAVDGETRCAHYRSANDIVALQAKCCGEWFPCHACHAALADHPWQVWPREDFSHRAVLCGACGYHLTIDEYLAARSACPRCHRPFNPGCAAHRHLYFATVPNE